MNNLEKVNSISKKINVNFGYDGPYDTSSKTREDYIWDREFPERKYQLNWLKKHLKWPLMHSLNKPMILHILVKNGLDLNKTIHIRDSLYTRGSYNMNMNRYISNIDSAIIWLNYNIDDEEKLDDFFSNNGLTSNDNFTASDIIDHVTEFHKEVSTFSELCNDTASIINSYLYGPLINKLNKYL